MKLVHPFYFDQIKISEYDPETIVIEKNDLFRRVINELVYQCNNNDGDFVLSENSNPLPLYKETVIITDFFTRTFDSKTLKTKINQKIIDESEKDDGDEIIMKINKLAFEICQRSSYPLMFNLNTSLTDIIKLLNFRIDEDNLSDLEAIFELINISANLFERKLIITVGLKDIVSEEEYHEFIKMIKYKKIRLLMFEHRQHSYDDLDHFCVIDEDMCVL